MKLRDLCFLTLLRDAMAGTCSTEAATLAKSMDWTLENQVLELAQLHHVFPLLAQQLLLLNPPDLRRDVLRHWAMEALARQALSAAACTRLRICVLPAMRTFSYSRRICRLPSRCSGHWATVYKAAQRIPCRSGMQIPFVWSCTAVSAAV